MKDDPDRFRLYPWAWRTENGDVQSGRGGRRHSDRATVDDAPTSEKSEPTAITDYTEGERDE